MSPFVDFVFSKERISRNPLPPRWRSELPSYQWPCISICTPNQGCTSKLITRGFQSRIGIHRVDWTMQPGLTESCLPSNVASYAFSPSRSGEQGTLPPTHTHTRITYIGLTLLSIPHSPRRHSITANIIFIIDASLHSATPNSDSASSMK